MVYCIRTNIKCPCLEMKYQQLTQKDDISVNNESSQIEAVSYYN